MDRRAFLAAAGTLGAGGLTPVAGCIGSRTKAEEGSTGSRNAKAHTIQIHHYHMVGGESSANYFDPIGLFAEPGDSITWVIVSGAHPHSSTAYETRIPEDANAWDSGTFSGKGTTFEHSLEVEGTYDYYSSTRKLNGMVGRIVVGEPGGPAEGSMPPDGAVPDSQTIVERGAVAYDMFTG